MRTRRREHAALCASLVLALAGCDTKLGEQLGVVGARDLAGRYTGLLAGVTVDSLEHLEDPERRVIVDLDLLHEVAIRATGAMTLRIESNVVPPFRALVLGIGPVAINAEFVEFEALAYSGGNLEFDALKVKQVVFVQHEGEWIVVLQLVRVGLEAPETVDGVYVYQYVSYPAAVAERMSEEEAIRYLNTILRLASAARRGG